MLSVSNFEINTCVNYIDSFSLFSDTLKVRLQTQPTVPQPIYNGLIDCFKKTLKWEGISGLYKGVASPIAGQMLFRAGMFFSFAEAKRAISGYGTRELTIADMYLAGGIACKFDRLSMIVWFNYVFLYISVVYDFIFHAYFSFLFSF